MGRDGAQASWMKAPRNPNQGANCGPDEEEKQQPPEQDRLGDINQPQSLQDWEEEAVALLDPTPPPLGIGGGFNGIMGELGGESGKEGKSDQEQQ